MPIKARRMHMPHQWLYTGKVHGTYLSKSSIVLKGEVLQGNFDGTIETMEIEYGSSHRLTRS